MTAPVPVVRAVGTRDGNVGTITPGFPAGNVAGDLLVMFTECDGAQTVTVSGWTECPGSPQSADTASSTDTKLQAFYRIYAAGASATTTDSGDHQVGRIIGIKAGTFDPVNPFNASGGGTDTTADTSGSIPGAVTTVANCLVLAACSSGFDVAGDGTAEFSGWANANLTNIVEQIDNTESSGNGGGIGVASGSYAGPGDYGATDVTLANASLKGMLSLAVAPWTGPYFDNAGAGAGTTGTTLTLPYPTGIAAGDMLIASIACSDKDDTFTMPSGWALITAAEQADANWQKHSAIYKVADGTESGNLSVTVTTVTANEGQVGRIYLFKGCSPQAPHAPSTVVSVAASTTVSAPSVTTTEPRELAIALVYIGSDTASVDFTGESGGDWTEALAEYTLNAGFGISHNLQMQTAVLASAGTISGGTFTITSARSVCLGFALKPARPSLLWNPSTPTIARL